jgi:hypothetical protein
MLGCIPKTEFVGQTVSTPAAFVGGSVVQVSARNSASLTSGFSLFPPSCQGNNAKTASFYMPFQ